MTVFNDDFITDAIQLLNTKMNHTVMTSKINEYIESCGEMNENVKGYIDILIDLLMEKPDEESDYRHNRGLVFVTEVGVFINHMYYAIDKGYHVDDATRIIEILEGLERVIRKTMVKREAIIDEIALAVFNKVSYHNNIIPFNKDDSEDN